MHLIDNHNNYKGCNMKSHTALRYLAMLKILPHGNGPAISTSDIHQKLIDEGFVVDKRTVERDLHKLTTLFEIECIKSSAPNAWRYTKLNWDVKPNMQPSEALALLLCRSKIEKLMPTERNWLKARFIKAEETLKSTNSYSNWQNKVQITSDSLSMDFDFSNSDIRNTIYHAVLKEQQIFINYKKENSPASKEYTLNPLGLILRDQSHYLVATKENFPEEPRLFLFHRMDKVEPLYTKIQKPNSFTIESYLSKQPSAFLLSDDKHTIVLKMKGYPLDIISRNELGQNQDIKPIDEQWKQVTFDSYLTYDLANWIIRYGGDVICQSPSLLLDYVKKKIKQSFDRYFQTDI